MLNNESIKKILIINAKYLGDLIVCTPAIKSIRNSFPQASISVLVREEYKNVLAGNPNINDIIPFDFSLKKVNGWKRIKAELNFVKLLRSKKFDAVVSLQSGDRYTEWAFLSGAKLRVAPKKQSMSFLLTNKVEVYEDTISYLNYYLQIAEAFGGKAVDRTTEFYLSKDFKEWTDEFKLKTRISDEDILVGIHPGASEPSKIWPFENFSKLIELLLMDARIKVLLFGGPAENKLMEKFQNGFSERLILADTSEDIQQLAWLINECKLFIANDSGARHIAAALKVKTLTLFPEDKLSCWKFYDEEDGHYFIIGKRNVEESLKMFLNGIEVEKVYDKAKQILG